MRYRRTASSRPGGWLLFILISCDHGSNEATGTGVDANVSTVDVAGSIGSDVIEAGDDVIEASDPSDRSEPLGAAPVLGLADSAIETFHDSNVDTCGVTKIHIDGPVRGFKHHNGVIHLTMSDPNARAWQWSGSSAAYSIHGRGNTYLFYRKSIATGHTRITRRAIAIRNYPLNRDAG